MRRATTLGGGVVLSACILGSGAVQAGTVDPGLMEILEQTPRDGRVSVLVFMADRVIADDLNAALDIGPVTRAQRHQFVVRALRDKAAATQGDLLEHLERLADAGRLEFEAFWIDNVVRVDASPRRIIAIGQREDVGSIALNAKLDLVRPVITPGAEGLDNAPQPVGGAEPGLIAVRAPEVWAQGITGAGRLVSSLDTGVDGNHEALADRWRGLEPGYDSEWAWFDPVTFTTFPQAFGSHGTHTMGTICGGAPGDQVGVAPGAQWIHAAVIDRVNIETTVADALLAFQWTADPDGNPATVFDVPDCSSNSWGLTDFHGYDDCDPFFWAAIDNLEAAGCVVVLAAGNEGSSGLRRPADRAIDDYRNFAVAAVNANLAGWPIAGFSSRGPTDCGPGGESAIKPDISAPGEDVRSSIPGGYGFLSGTSMATPHIAGVVALMREANPDIPVDEIKQIIYDTAFDLGDPDEDNTYGWGMVDAYEAVQAALATATLTFSFPEGRPDQLEPNGGTIIPIVITGVQNTPVPSTAMLHYSTGGPFTALPLEQTGPDEYEAVFPALPCGAQVNYYFSIDTEEQETVFNPFAAPGNAYVAMAFSGTLVPFADDFEADQGWTVQDSAGLTTGTWVRTIPLGGGPLDDPDEDSDGSGNAYITGTAADDVDNGTTTLTSPVMDASAPGSIIAYDRWYFVQPNPPNDDFIVEVSDDAGASWVQLESIGTGGGEISGGWVHKEFVISSVPGITNTDQFMIRFIAGDLEPQSYVEAGVDAVQLTSVFCNPAPCPDLDGDGVVGTADLLDLLAAWGPNPGHPADLNGDDDVGTADLLILLAEWGACE